jgi:glyoxylase-like metal-dependent hydrolase (beta-lactamase superfamily II)
MSAGLRRRTLLGAGCAAGVLSGCAHARPRSTVDLQTLAPDVWFAQGEAALGSRENRNFISNAGVIVAPQGVVLVDALGSPALARELLSAIAARTAKPVTAVIVTHYHADHVYGLQVFAQAGARIIAHRAAREYLQSEAARLRLTNSIAEGLTETGTRLVEATQWVDGSAALDLAGETFELRAVGPAHTAEDLAVWLPARRVLFAGDLVFRGRIPFVGQADSRGWIASLDTMLTLPAVTIVPGHGPLSRSAREDLLLTRDYLAHLRKHMGRAVAEFSAFDEAYAATDWSRFEALPLFRVANRMNAYNTYLLMEQEALHKR